MDIDYSPHPWCSRRHDCHYATNVGSGNLTAPFGQHQDHSPPLLTNLRRSHRSVRRPRRRLGKPRRDLAEFLSKQANLDWALRLPSKAQQIYFSPEEQARLTAVAPPSPCRLTQELVRSPIASESWLSDESEPPSPELLPLQTPEAMDSVHFENLYHWKAHEAFLDSYNQTVASPPLGTTPAITVPTPATPIVEPQRPRSRHPSFKRALSLITDTNERPLPPLPTAKADYSDLPMSPMSPTYPQKPARKSWTGSRRSVAKNTGPFLPVLPEPRGPLQYYNDPDARMKLKVYLGSAQKFEEALEFGFPSTAPAEAEVPRIPTPVARTPRDPMATAGGGGSNDLQRFLRNDIISWLDNENETSSDPEGYEGSDDEYDDHDDDEDDDQGVRLDTPRPLPDRPTAHRVGSYDDDFDVDEYASDDFSSPASPTDHNSPMTPRDCEFQPMSPPLERPSSKHHSFGALRPYSRRAPAPLSSSVASPPLPSWATQHGQPSLPTSPTSPAAVGWPGAREMTLRMTLTRPELRAPDEQMYTAARPHARSDPMDLPPLMEDGLPREERGRVKSLWKKMSISGIKR